MRVRRVEWGLEESEAGVVQWNVFEKSGVHGRRVEQTRVEWRIVVK